MLESLNEGLKIADALATPQTTTSESLDGGTQASILLEDTQGDSNYSQNSEPSINLSDHYRLLKLFLWSILSLASITPPITTTTRQKWVSRLNYSLRARQYPEAASTQSDKGHIWPGCWRTSEYLKVCSWADKQLPWVAFNTVSLMFSKQRKTTTLWGAGVVSLEGTVQKPPGPTERWWWIVF